MVRDKKKNNNNKNTTTTAVIIQYCNNKNGPEKWVRDGGLRAWGAWGLGGLVEAWMEHGPFWSVVKSTFIVVLVVLVILAVLAVLLA